MPIIRHTLTLREVVSEDEDWYEDTYLDESIRRTIDGERFEYHAFRGENSKDWPTYTDIRRDR